MFKVNVTSVLSLEAFDSYSLGWWLFVCWVFFGWLGFAVISERDERQNKQWAHRGGLKNLKGLAFVFGAFFLPQVDTAAADGLPGPNTHRGEEVKAFSAF